MVDKRNFDGSAGAGDGSIVLVHKKLKKEHACQF
jgi:hypothetical protein